MRILVTGGAGYIGTHTLLQLVEAKHKVLVLDNLANGHIDAVRRIEQLVNASIPVIEGDIRDGDRLARAFENFKPEAVIHFAGLKSVSESVVDPLSYYDVNVGGTRTLLKAMEASGCKRMIFSSSATVYGTAAYLPYDEFHPVAPVNPYGQSKRMVEIILTDWCQADRERKAFSLRYFNPVGAHPSGVIGESPAGAPNNLMPYISQTAIGRRKVLRIHGNDYATRDGTGERDYIHVVDLSKAHVSALSALDRQQGHSVVNIGTGKGITVNEMIKAFEAINDVRIRTTVGPRRPGDVARAWADTTRAEELLGWRAELSLAEMCRDAWAWQSKNPQGFST